MHILHSDPESKDDIFEKFENLSNVALGKEKFQVDEALKEMFNRWWGCRTRLSALQYIFQVCDIILLISC